MDFIRRTIEGLVFRLRKVNYIELVVMGIGILLALYLRYSLRSFRSLDFIVNTGVWYARIRNQGFSALQDKFVQYTPPYPYLLYLVSITFPKIEDVAAVKIPAVAADFLCAWFVYRIVRLKYTKGLVPAAAFSAVLFAPTIVINSSLWGQCDSLYTTALIACIYFLITRREKLTYIAFGIALAFKLQAVFLAPVLVIFLLKKEISWKGLFLIPLVYLLAIIPAWLAGRPLVDLLTLFLTQVDWSSSLSFGAPNLYAWLPVSSFNLFYLPGLILSGVVCSLFIFLATKSRSKRTSSVIILLALLSVVLMPFLLPKMHERYFYPADVLSIVFAFYYPDLFFVPILIILSSLFAYFPFLFNLEIIPMPVLAFVMLISIALLVYRLFRELDFISHTSSDRT
jgi:Gpi18-like mannosyltransferase